MPDIGDVYEYPKTGERLVVAQLGDDSLGEPYRLDVTASAHSSGPPLHFHPHSKETFHVQTGTLNIRSGKTTRVVGQGETVVVPAGTPHRFWNNTDADAQFTTEILPAFRSANYFEAIHPIVTGSRVNPLQLAVLLREYRQEARFGGPLGWLLAVMAPIGRAFGIRG